MGYHVSAIGAAVLKKNVDKKELEKKLNSLNTWIDYDIDDTGIRWCENGNYNEDETEEFLNTLTPYIESGDAEYTGEEGDMWRYILVNGVWEEQSGRIYYTNEDMIKALEREGYTVTMCKTSN